MSFLRDLTKPNCPVPFEHIWYLVWDENDVVRWDCHQCRAEASLQEFKEALGLADEALTRVRDSVAQLESDEVMH